MMIRRHRPRAGLALAVVIAAVAAPSASAMEANRFLNSDPAHAGRAASPAPPQVRVVEVPAGSGFDWADAGIGAGVAFATIGLGGAVVLGSRRRHGGPATAG